MNWSEIIRQIESSIGSVAEIARRIDVEPRYIHDIKSGRSKNPTTSFTEGLVTKLGVSADWIFTGTGSMFLPGREPSGFVAKTHFVADVPAGKSHFPAPNFPAVRNHFPAPEIPGVIVPTDETAITPEPTPEIIDGIPTFDARPSELRPDIAGTLIPTEGRITVARGTRYIALENRRVDDDIVLIHSSEQRASAGTGTEISQIDDDVLVPVPRSFVAGYNPDLIYSLQVHGDSMTGVQIFHGDRIFYVQSHAPGDGIYVLRVDNALLVKRLSVDYINKCVLIISENAKYPPVTINMIDLSDRLVIEGKVIGWIHRHPY